MGVFLQQVPAISLGLVVLELGGSGPGGGGAEAAVHSGEVQVPLTGVGWRPEVSWGGDEGAGRVNGSWVGIGGMSQERRVRVVGVLERSMKALVGITQGTL